MTLPNLCSVLQEMEADFGRRAAELAPYDALAWVGYPARSHVSWPDAIAAADALEAGPIHRALLSHTAGMLHDPIAGNRMLAEVLQALPGCHGVMSLLPGTLQPDWDIRAHIDVCFRAGMRAARLLPKLHRYTLKTPGMQELFEALAVRRIPLFLPIGQTSWDELGAIALAYPKLNILAESAGHHEYLNMRAALPWLEKVSNVFVPTNRQFLAGGIELLVERLGAHRVLFASGQPIEDPWASLGPLVMNRLSDAACLQIAHENLERLLAEAHEGENAL